MNHLNCPNCGAPIDGDKCEYCGTHFMDCTMDAEKPFYIKIRRGNALFIDKVFLSQMQVSAYDDSCYMDDICGRRIRFPRIHRTYSIELESLGMD